MIIPRQASHSRQSASADQPAPPLAVLQQASIGYPANTVLHNLNLQLHSGELCCLLGANGCGKTTLLRTLQGLLPPLSGQVLFAGKPLADWSRRALSRHIAFVPQAHHSPFAFTALEMVLMGFHSQLAWFASPGKPQRQQALHALDSLHIARLASRLFPTLSGGEQQLVLIARALVQQPRLLIMDEPAASLDFAHQILLLDTLRGLKQQGITLLMSTHHPLHAHALADRVIAIHHDGRLQTGSPQQLLNIPALANLYQVSVSAMQRHLTPYIT